MITIRNLLAMTVSAAALVAFPSTALAGKSLFVSPYKVEDHVELEGEDGSYTLSCKDSTDIATDGMWRVDNVDQDNDWEDPDPALATFWGPPSAGIGTSPDLTIRKAIRPMAVYGDAATASKYHFAFTPLAGADVQIKLWIICIPNPVQGFGHSHKWVVSSGTSPATSTVDPQTTDPGTFATTKASCGSKKLLIQPGFKLTSTGNHVITSQPYASGTWDGSWWEWRTYNDGTDAASTAEYSWRCLDVKSSAPLSPATGTHTHRFVFNKKSTTWDDSGTPANPKVGPQQVTERQNSCGEHYKALIGGWDLVGTWRAAYTGAGPHYPAHMWVYFLGMDPRIKTRAFRFLNTDEIAGTVTTSVVCFKDRTT